MARVTGLNKPHSPAFARLKGETLFDIVDYGFALPPLPPDAKASVQTRKLEIMIPFAIFTLLLQMYALIDMDTLFISAGDQLL